MAKQRRPHSKPSPKKRSRAAASPRAKAQRRTPAPAAPAPPAPAPPPQPSPRELSHRQAVAAYERGLQALQNHRYAEAARVLRSVLDGFPEEKELHERVQLYLNVCQRQMVPRDATPQTIEEQVYAATLAINAGAYDRGLAELQALSREHPDNDHVHYMLAVVQTLRRDLASALLSLQRAVELNHENRFLAWQDADLEGLRDHPRFRVAVGAVFRRDRRDPPRARTAR